MEIIEVNSKITDILFSIDEMTGVSYFMLRKENGDLVGEDEFFCQSGNSSLMKSLISKHTYHVCLYHRSNGDVVRRLKVLKKRQEEKVLKRFKNKLNAFYYHTLFSNLIVKTAWFNHNSNSIEISFINGKVINLKLNRLI